MSFLGAMVRPNPLRQLGILSFSGWQEKPGIERKKIRMIAAGHDFPKVHSIQAEEITSAVSGWRCDRQGMRERSL